MGSEHRYQRTVSVPDGVAATLFGEDVSCAFLGCAEDGFGGSGGGGEITSGSRIGEGLRRSWDIVVRLL